MEELLAAFLPITGGTGYFPGHPQWGSFTADSFGQKILKKLKRRQAYHLQSFPAKSTLDQLGHQVKKREADCDEGEVAQAGIIIHSAN